MADLIFLERANHIIMELVCVDLVFEVFVFGVVSLELGVLRSSELAFLCRAERLNRS